MEAWKFFGPTFLSNQNQIKINNHSDLKKIELLKTKTWWSKDLKQNTVKHQNQPNIHLEIKGLFYVVKPHPHGVGDLKSQNPGAPWGGEFIISKPRGPHGVGDLNIHGGSQTLVRNKNTLIRSFWSGKYFCIFKNNFEII